MAENVFFSKRRKSNSYSVDLKRNLKLTDTKKAGCGDRLFSCDRLLEETITPQIVGLILAVYSCIRNRKS
jgi:hypothetical protein